MDDSPSAAASDTRQQRRHFTEVTEGTRRFTNPEELLGTYVNPFACTFGVEYLPSSLQPYCPSDTFSFFSSTGEVDALLVEAVQTSLLTRIVVDWSASLTPQVLQDLLRCWLFGPLSSTAATSVAQGKVQQCTSRTLSRQLSSTAFPASTVHPITRSILSQICVEALAQLSLPSLIASIVKGEKNKARADVAWGETLRLLSSLPDRLANFTQGELPCKFTATTWIEQVFVSGIAATLAQSCEAEELKLLKDVLMRLDKMGYLTQAVDVGGRGFWPTLLHHERVADKWPKLGAKLGSGLRLKLERCLLETLQYMVTVRKGLPTGLITAQERTRPGTEGVAFFSNVAQEAVAATSLVLAACLKPPTSDDEGSDSDSDSDTDSGTEEKVVKTFSNVALTTTSHSPVIAWAWTTYLSTHLGPSSLLPCLRSSLDRWSDSKRISRSLIEEEIYLTTLIVTLLSTIPAGAKEQLGELSRSSTLLNGVSRHLEHSDPLTRRMGMLVAELISAKSVKEGEEGGKALSFGKGVWNGKGEGREEARVLRGLSDGWDYHSSAIRSIREGGGMNGLPQAVAVLAIVPAEGEKKEAEELVEMGERVKVKEREKAKTTRLPRRVAPPRRSTTNGSGSKSRPLITMIDSDEDDLLPPKEANPGPLKMFSRPQTSTSSRDSSASPSSASEDDSDDSDAPPGSSEAEIQRLASELSGLSPSEAQHHLSSHPSSSSLFPPSSKPKQPRTKSKITDLDADTESHAPQFTKKTPVPVYISQLSPLLKSSDRASVRTALHNAARLIELKGSTPKFGQEVRENAVDLTLSLVALHDNLGIKRFEIMRREALVELAKVEAGVVVGVLNEQVFGGQYSAVQRGAMLEAIVGSALALSGAGAREGEGKVKGEIEVARRADKVVEGVIKGAREVGEQKVPAIRRQRNLQVHPSSPSASRVALIQPLNSHPSSLAASMTAETRTEQWTTLAGPTFLFPLLNRLLAYTHHHQTRFTLGAGAGALFQPETQSLLLDTLTILLPLLPRSRHLVLSATLPLIELLSLLLNPSTLAAREGAGVGVGESSALNLLAVTLHAHIKLDGGETLVGESALVERLRMLLGTVQQVFTTLQAGDPGSRAKQPGSRQKTLSRCATILLLMDELDQHRQEALRQALGFILPSS